jgi:arginine decarboxylase
LTEWVKPFPVGIDAVKHRTQHDDTEQSWSIDRSADLYGVPRWSGGYASINPQGHVCVHPCRQLERSIDLVELTRQLRERGLQTPLLIRFPQIIEDRLIAIQQAFEKARAEFSYRGGYRGVYPIKVNQQRHVIEDLIRYGRPMGYGLEVGSKPELIAAMALIDDPQTLLICNGFKDEAFIEAVMIARKLGRNVIPVIEKKGELELIIRQAKAHQVRPAIGVRVKLASGGAGKWESTGGDQSKFGLTISQVVGVVDRLRDAQMLDCLKLTHSHLGSQLSDIRALKPAMMEAARVYAEIKKLGAGLEMLDVGGGLGVDYDGSRSGNESSLNYSLEEYANNVVYHVGEVCDAVGVEHPTLITEAGRAMVAHHSVLIMDVLGQAERANGSEPHETGPADEDLPEPIRTLVETHREIDQCDPREAFHDAQVARKQMLTLFNLGYCNLEQRGIGERAFHAISQHIHRVSQLNHEEAPELAALDRLLCDIYYCNFSIFQSLPDSWAIDQLFPIMPLQRLDERPTRQGILADITCDSDGTVDRFIDASGSLEPYRPTLDLHPLDDDDYLLGVFLVGAYQETLGDLHNLFGDTTAVHVMLDAEGKVNVDEIVEGDTIAEVLSYVQFDIDKLRQRLSDSLKLAELSERVTPEESRALNRFYESSLSGYTYLT